MMLLVSTLGACSAFDIAKTAIDGMGALTDEKGTDESINVDTTLDVHKGSRSTAVETTAKKEVKNVQGDFNNTSNGIDPLWFVSSLVVMVGMVLVLMWSFYRMGLQRPRPIQFRSEREQIEMNRLRKLLDDKV